MMKRLTMAATKKSCCRARLKTTRQSTVINAKSVWISAIKLLALANAHAGTIHKSVIYENAQWVRTNLILTT